MLEDFFRAKFNNGDVKIFTCHIPKQLYTAITWPDTINYLIISC